MNYTVSDNMKQMKPSIIREILKYSGTPGMVSFAAGNPASETFPTETILNIATQVLETEPSSVLQYSVSEGYPPLRAEVKRWLDDDYGISSDGYDLLITSGAQQSLDLITKVLCNRGDVILAERPSFVGALNCFRSYGVKLYDVPMEPDGMVLAVLEEQIIAHKPKFLYVIPNFQNPTGYTTSLEKRRGILEICKKYNVPIVEDNPYGDLRFAGEAVPSIKSLDNGGNQVIYLGSFSKILAPGIRVGYVLAPKEIFGALTVGKQCTDVHTTALSQVICHRFLTETDMKAHVEKLCNVYRRKANLMMDQIKQKCGDKLQFVPVEGGLFLWATLPRHIDMMAFCEEAVKRGVAMVPGNALFCDDSAPCSSVRLNYSTPSDEDIVKGVDIIATLLKEKCNEV